MRAVRVGSACVSIFAGSEPTFVSVSAKAEISPPATRGRYRRFLLLGAEKHQRLRHADRLMRGEQRGQVAAIAAEQHRGAAVVRLRQAEPAVFDGDLDAERAELREAVEDVLRDFAGAIDLIGIDVLVEKAAEPLEKSVALVAVFGALERKRMQRRQSRSVP